jgi:hypothetical protein
MAIEVVLWLIYRDSGLPGVGRFMAALDVARGVTL